MDWKERDREVGGGILRVREAGDPDGSAVPHLQGTPSCRLEMEWGDDLAAAAVVRVVTFDRPGSDGSALVAAAPDGRFGR